MKPLLAALAVFILSTSSAIAQCPYGSAKPLKVSQWQKTPITRQGLSVLTVIVENTTKRPIRMVDASIRAYDKLGREIGGWLMDPDTSFDADGVIEEDQVLPFMLPRLLNMNADDAKFFVCTKGIVFGDGETVRF